MGGVLCGSHTNRSPQGGSENRQTESGSLGSCLKPAVMGEPTAFIQGRGGGGELGQGVGGRRPQEGEGWGMGGGAMMQPEYMGAPAVLGYGVWGHSLPLRVWGHSLSLGAGGQYRVWDQPQPQGFGVTHRPPTQVWGHPRPLGYRIWGHLLPPGIWGLGPPTPPGIRVTRCPWNVGYGVTPCPPGYGTRGRPQLGATHTAPFLPVQVTPWPW